MSHRHLNRKFIEDLCESYVNRDKVTVPILNKQYPEIAARSMSLAEYRIRISSIIVNCDNCLDTYVNNLTNLHELSARIRQETGEPPKSLYDFDPLKILPKESKEIF
jgi:hypothetical protein